MPSNFRGRLKCFAIPSFFAVLLIFSTAKANPSHSVAHDLDEPNSSDSNNAGTKELHFPEDPLSEEEQHRLDDRRNYLRTPEGQAELRALEEREERIRAAYSTGDFTSLSEGELRAELAEQHQYFSFAARGGKDTSEIQLKIRQLQASLYERSGSPRIHIATDSNKPRHGESFITLYGALRQYQETGHWPASNIWDLGQNYGLNPHRYLTQARHNGQTENEGDRTARSEVTPHASGDGHSRFFSLAPPAPYNPPDEELPRGDRALNVPSILHNNPLILAAHPSTDLNGAIGGQVDLMARHNGRVFIVGAPNENGISDPVGDSIRIFLTPRRMWARASSKISV